MQDIHDIRPPMMVGMDPATVRLILMIAAGLAVALVLFLLIRYLIKKRKPRPVLPLESAVPPYDRAMAGLARLSDQTDMDPKAFYFELGRTVKAYMGEVFGRKCLEMTTQELIRTVRDLPVSRELKGEIGAFQDLCDPFRYAPVTPSPERIRKDLSGARALIDRMERETRPREDEADGGVAADTCGGEGR